MGTEHFPNVHDVYINTCDGKQGAGGRVNLAIGSQTRDRFHPYSPRSTRVSKVFKECDFGECTGKEIYPKALTFPVDNLLLKRELVAVHLDKALPTYTPKGCLLFVHLSPAI